MFSTALYVFQWVSCIVHGGPASTLFSKKKNFKTALCVFFWISCHSIWPISHLHTIPLERCAFLYALVTDTSVSFPHLFIRSLIEVHRSSSTTHGLFFLVFIHRILFHLG